MCIDGVENNMCTELERKPRVQAQGASLDLHLMKGAGAQTQ